MISPEEIGWVAGIVDTKAWLSYRRVDHTRLPVMSVTLHDDPQGHAIAKKLCKLTGMKPIMTGKGYNRYGCDSHCPDKHVHVLGRYIRFSVSGARLVVLLNNVYPHLVAKKRKAKELLDLKAEYKQAHFEAMRKLGWKI